MGKRPGDIDPLLEPLLAPTRDEEGDMFLSQLIVTHADPVIKGGIRQKLHLNSHGGIEQAELVTLSACDTGLGEIRIGEGVQGLRRALVLAGSESQVMSLWAVSDDRAKDVMIPYYKALRRGEGRGEGLRQAQLRMLRSKEHRHPFYWATFIQSGEWANLNGRR